MKPSPYNPSTIWSRAIIFTLCLGLNSLWADISLNDFEWSSSSVTTLSYQGGGDYSGVAYVADRNSIFIADNKQNALFEYNATTFAFKKKININLGLADLEGVDYMYDNRFVLSDEGLNQLVVVNISSTDASITSSDELYRLSPSIFPVSNKGLEGVTYDPVSAASTVDAFFMIQEKPPTLYSINQGGGMTIINLSAHMSDAAGVSVSPDGNSILVVGEENKTLFRFNRNGVKLQEQSLSNFNQPEGIELNSDGTKMFIVGESREVSMIEAPPPPVVINPSVSIQKTVMLGANGPQTCPGSEVVTGTSGATATYCYFISNTGDTTLSNLSISDAGANLNVPNLAPGGVTTDVRTFSIQASVSTLATVTGTPVDALGNAYPNQANVANADGATVNMQVINQPSPSIMIAKTVVLNNTATCPGSEQVSGPADASLTYCYAIANTGDTVLQNVTIVDNAANPAISINVGTIGIGGATMQSASATIQGSANIAARVTATPVTGAGSLPNVSSQDAAEVIETVDNDGGNNGGGGVAASWSGQISSGLNDAEYNVYGPNLGSYDLDLGQKDVAVRFENVTIPVGATITSAKLIFTARRSRRTTTRTTISGINVLPSVDFSQAGSGLDGSALTSANLNWITQNWSAGDEIDSPDLAALVQELVDTASWTEGYPMAFHLFGISGKQEAFTSEISPSQATRLEIDYTLPADPDGNGNGNGNGGGTPDLPVVLADFQGASEVLEQVITDGTNDGEFRYYMIVGSKDLDIGQKDVGLRFPNLDIPAGARVTGGNLEFIARRTLSIPTSVSIEISNAEDARPFNEAANVLNGGETLSGANVPWSPSAWTAGQAYPSPDLRNVIASQIHADSWVTGQHLSFALDYQGGKREAVSYELNPADAPGLRINYERPPVLRHATMSSGGIGFTTWQEDDVVAFHLVDNDSVLGSATAGDATYSIAAPLNGEFVDLDVEYADRFERMTLRRAAPQTGGTLNLYYHTGGGEFTTANGANLLTGYTRPPLVLDVTDPATPVVIVGETVMNGAEYGVYFTVESGRTIRVTE